MLTRDTAVVNNTFSPASCVNGGVVLSGGLAASSFRVDASLKTRSSNILPDVPGASHVHRGSSPRLYSLLEVGTKVRRVDDKRCWGHNLRLPQSRIGGFGSLDAWLDAFMYTLKRDTIFNVAKIGGLILLHYLAPGMLTWFSNSFG